MPTSSSDLWYQLGFALEQTRRHPTRERVHDLAAKIAAFRDGNQAKSRSGGPSSSAPPSRNGGDPVDGLITTLTEGLTAGVLRLWPARHQPQPMHWVRGAAAGAAAVVVQELVHVALHRDPESLAQRSRGLPERLLAGAARGVIYGGLAEPRLPGPRIVQGVIFATVEYVASPLGGLGHLLGRFAPYARIPVLRSVVEGSSEGDDDYLDHLVFGVATALMAVSGDD